MKSGLIVYLVGEAELPEDLNLTDHLKELGFLADRVELVGSRQEFSQVEDAWHHVYTKGYGDIKLLVAQREQNRLCPLHPLQPLLRLCG